MIDYYTLSTVYSGSEVVLHITIRHSTLESFARHRSTFYVETEWAPRWEVRAYRNWMILAA
jgi:hypothetical protein